MDRTPRRIQPGTVATDRSGQPLQHEQNPIVTEDHLKIHFCAAAAAAAATSQFWDMEGVPSGHTPLPSSYSASLKGMSVPGRRSFSEGGSASTRSVPVASVAEEVTEIPRQRITDLKKASELDLSPAGYVSAAQPSVPEFLTNEPQSAISSTGGVFNITGFTALSETGELRREIEELRSQVLILRAS
jgi:hypothetical protein